MCETRKCPYPKLFSPLKVGSITLRNRIVAAPITKYGLEPSPADELELVAAKARGGAGLVILGSCAVNDEESLIYFEGSSLDGRKRPLYNEEISVIHQYGAKAAVQLLHCGMWADLRGKPAARWDRTPWREWEIIRVWKESKTIRLWTEGSLTVWMRREWTGSADSMSTAP